MDLTIERVSFISHSQSRKSRTETGVQSGARESRETRTIQPKKTKITVVGERCPGSVQDKDDPEIKKQKSISNGYVGSLVLRSY